MKSFTLFALCLTAVSFANAKPARPFPYQVETIMGQDNDYAIKITHRPSGKVQIINDLAAFNAKELDLIDLDDYNGDGYTDIAATVSAGETLNGTNLYLYQPKTGQFAEAEGMENMGQIEADGKGCVLVSYRINSMDYNEDRYCWKKDHWQTARKR